MNTVTPEPKQPVTLHADGLGRLGARVEQVGEDELLLALVLEPGSVIQFGTRGDAAIEFTTRRGLVRVHGEVTGAARKDEVTFRPGGAPAVVQRREFARVDAVRPVAVETDALSKIDTYTINVSGGGMLIAGPDTLKIGTPVYLKLKLDEGLEPIQLEGTVVRETPEGFKGVRIEHIDKRDRDLIVRFVFDRERVARAMTRDG